MGRPVKIEGNPLHPAVPEIMAAAQEGSRLRFGATNAFAQASVLSLYDPDRSQTVLRDGQISTWGAFTADLQPTLSALAEAGGRGLRILTETVVSPTLADQLRQLLELYPNAAWHQYEPINRDNEQLGNQLAFGADVQAVYHVEAADVIVSLDADFIADGPLQLQQARGFANRRRVAGNGGDGLAAMNRLYVVESSATITGAAADHRLPLPPQAVQSFALRLAAALGLSVDRTRAESATPDGAKIPQAWLDAVAADLKQSAGRGLVIAGRAQPPFVHALAHWINSTLGNIPTTLEYAEPIAARPEPHVDSLRNLVEEMRAGEVRVLLILGGNPVYDAPADFNFSAALENVSQMNQTVHLSQYEDETSARCLWHIPELHFLESWSDTRAGDGTASIVQPLVAPLRSGKSAHEVLAALLGNPATSAYEIVRAYWQGRLSEQTSAGESTRWQQALHDGVVANTSAPTVQPTIRADFATALSEHLAAAEAPSEGMSIVFQPDPFVWDGRYASPVRSRL
jgi:molybdopterin-containing oxidoreductase family iron-sulfur binding subunit